MRNRKGDNGKKACVCSHGKASHHPERRANRQEPRSLCWYPNCKCTDYNPVAQPDRIDQ